jgi:LysR family transcriptional regulator of gallate degradation
MIPTDVGDRWRVRFERVLAELRHIVADVAALRGVLEGVVTVGALPLGRTQLLPMAIANLHARHPRLRFLSLESPYEELAAGLLSGRIDLILGALRPGSAQGMELESLFEDRVSLIAGASHPLASRRKLALADVEAYPWVLSRANAPLREALDRYFAAQGRTSPVPLVETGDLALLRGLLLRGEMITVLSAHQLHYEIAQGWLCELDIVMPGLNRPIGITTRAGARLSPGADALIAELRTCGVNWQ